jgi:hypothetical protein
VRFQLTFLHAVAAVFFRNVQVLVQLVLVNAQHISPAKNVTASWTLFGQTAGSRDDIFDTRTSGGIIGAYNYRLQPTTPPWSSRPFQQTHGGSRLSRSLFEQGRRRVNVRGVLYGGGSVWSESSEYASALVAPQLSQPGLDRTQDKLLE